MRVLRIVIADDNFDFRTQLREILEHGTPYQVVGEASDGAEAIRLTLQHKPDVTILDGVMPEVDGIEATKAIKADLPKTFVIGLTGSDTMLEKLKEAGADNCLVKGDSLPILFDLLSTL